MIGPLFGMMMGTAIAHDSGNSLMSTNQDRMGLANGVTGGESMQDVASLAQQDKSLALKARMDEVYFKAGMLMADSARKQLAKNEEMRRRLAADGAGLY